MKVRVVKNIEASMRARLLQYAKAADENYNAVLNRFFQERFLARLSVSGYKPHFILKGGLLLLAEHVSTFRPTVDIDMLGTKIDNSPETLKKVIEEICAIPLSDGVIFDTNDLKIQSLKEDAEYEGLRFTIPAYLGKMRSRVQIDIGFGDDIPEGFSEKTFPTILPDLQSPQLLFYPLESVIAEKLQAMVYLGTANSRMKDFFDIRFLAEGNSFSSEKLRKAIEATFARRETDLAERVLLYKREYSEQMSAKWRIFLRKIHSEESSKFSEVMLKLQHFIEPILSDEKKNQQWLPDKWKWAEN